MIDFVNDSVGTIVSSLLNFYYSNYQRGDSKKCFYCGITNDVKRRLQEHEKEYNGSISVCISGNCGTYEKSSAVEKQMKDLDFDIGNPNQIGQGGVENSIYVYLFRKP